MEHISKVLEHYQPTIQSQRTFEVDNMSDKERLRRNLNVSSLDNTFKNFKKRKGTELAYEAFYNFANDDAPPFLGCYGGVGCGKSHLLEATAIKLTERGVFARVIPATLVYSALKGAMSPGSIPGYQDILQAYCKAKILLLDDVGAGMMDTEWAYSVLEEIVLYRFNERLRTVFITNKDFTDLPPRIVSRFKDAELSVLVLNTADDYRKLKGAK